MSRLSAVYRSTRRHARCDELAADALILMQLLSALGGRVWHHCLLRVLVVSFERCCAAESKTKEKSSVEPQRRAFYRSTEIGRPILKEPSLTIPVEPVEPEFSRWHIQTRLYLKP